MFTNFRALGAAWGITALFTLMVSGFTATRQAFLGVRGPDQTQRPVATSSINRTPRDRAGNQGDRFRQAEPDPEIFQDLGGRITENDIDLPSPSQLVHRPVVRVPRRQLSEADRQRVSNRTQDAAEFKYKKLSANRQTWKQMLLIMYDFESYVVELVARFDVEFEPGWEYNPDICQIFVDCLPRFRDAILAVFDFPRNEKDRPVLNMLCNEINSNIFEYCEARRYAYPFPNLEKQKKHMEYKKKETLIFLIK